jgi:anti-sigma regulatory factor (Ser/Thr protein kinase)
VRGRNGSLNYDEERSSVVSTVFEVQLPRAPEAPGRARLQLEEWFAADVDDAGLRTARLLVSELVTNAVLHGKGTITLRAALDEDRLLVEVIDQGSGFERVLDEHDFEQVGGWGLRIVDTEASRWGVHEGTTHVWFELERPGPRIGAPENPLEP